MSNHRQPPEEYDRDHWVPPPTRYEPIPPEQQAMIRARQRSRAIVMAIGLALLVILFFGISIAKMSK